MHHTKDNVKSQFYFYIILLVITCVWGKHAHAQASHSSAYLNLWLQESELKFGEKAVDTKTLYKAYTLQNFQSLWVDEHGLNAKGKAVINAMAHAEQHGLKPENYGINIINAIAAMHPPTPHKITQRNLSLELLISHGVLHYIADLKSGSVARQWNTGAAKLTPEDIASTLYQIAQAPDVAKAIENFAPQTEQYHLLKRALKHHKNLAAQGGWESFPKGKKLSPDAEDSRVSALKRILVAQGDLTPHHAQTNIYDAQTVEAVKQFQTRHGIAPDGVIGSMTQQKLNISAQEGVEQIILSLERMRWMKRDLGNRYVIINVPAYKLKAVADGKTLDMDVIVGTTRTKTPLFSKEITNVVMNPTWSVPASIAVKGMLPKIQNDPDFLNRSGFKVLTQDGETIHPYEVDWYNLGRDYFPYKLRQNAGWGNALGKVKFTIPNSGNIFMHDTSQPKLFSRSERSLSHGCIRLSNPEAMTRFILTSEGWSEDKVNKSYNSRSSRTVKIAPIPVHTVYWTAWVDDEGRTRFNSDIYRMNKRLTVALNKNTPKGQEKALQLAMR